jgi:hypothetical protein
MPIRGSGSKLGQQPDETGGIGVPYGASRDGFTSQTNTGFNLGGLQTG